MPCPMCESAMRAIAAFRGVIENLTQLVHRCETRRGEARTGDRENLLPKLIPLPWFSKTTCGGAQETKQGARQDDCWLPTAIFTPTASASNVTVSNATPTQDRTDSRSKKTSILSTKVIAPSEPAKHINKEMQGCVDRRNTSPLPSTSKAKGKYQTDGRDKTTSKGRSDSRKDYEMLTEVAAHLPTTLKATIEDWADGRSKETKKMDRQRKDGQMNPTVVVAFLTPALKAIQNYSNSKKTRKFVDSGKDRETIPAAMVASLTPALNAIIQNYSRGKRIWKMDGGRKYRQISDVFRPVIVTPSSSSTSKATPQGWYNGTRDKETRKVEVGKKHDKMQPTNVAAPPSTTTTKTNAQGSIDNGSQSIRVLDGGRMNGDEISIEMVTQPLPTTPKIIALPWKDTSCRTEAGQPGHEKSEENISDGKAMETSTAKLTSAQESFSAEKQKPKESSEKKRNGSILLRFPAATRVSLPSRQPDAVHAKKGTEGPKRVRRFPEGQQCAFCGYFTRSRHLWRHFRAIHQGCGADEAVFKDYGRVRTPAPLRACPAHRRPPARVLALVDRPDWNWLYGWTTKLG